MNAQDYARYQQAEALANSGQTRAAHKVFCALRDSGNADVEIFFWIATTATNPFEARQAINTVRQLQPYHPRLPALVAFHARRQRQAIRTRLWCAFYFVAIACIFPIATMNTLKIIAIIYIVLFNTVLVVNIIRLAYRQRALNTVNALYIGALIGFFMAALIRAPTSQAVFDVSILYITVYTVVVAIRGIVTGKL